MAMPPSVFDGLDPPAMLASSPHHRAYARLARTRQARASRDEPARPLRASTAHQSGVHLIISVLTSQPVRMANGCSSTTTKRPSSLLLLCRNSIGKCIASPM